MGALVSKATIFLQVSIERVYNACENLVKQNTSRVFYASIFCNINEPDIDEQNLKHLTDVSVTIVLLDRVYRVFLTRRKYDLVSIDHLTGQLLVAENLIHAGLEKLTYLQ